MFCFFRTELGSGSTLEIRSCHGELDWRLCKGKFSSKTFIESFQPFWHLSCLKWVGSNLSKGDVSNHDLSIVLTDRTTFCRKCVQNIITREKQRRPLGRESLGAPFGCKPLLVHSLQYCDHCTSLKNDVSVIKNDVSTHHTCCKFLTNRDLTKKKNCAICWKFHSTHFLTQSNLANRTDPVWNELVKFYQKTNCWKNKMPQKFSLSTKELSLTNLTYSSWKPLTQI